MAVIDDKLVVFLYLLVRDHLPFGAVMSILKDLDGSGPWDVTNNEMNLWAQVVAARLREKEVG